MMFAAIINAVLNATFTTTAGEVARLSKTKVMTHVGGGAGLYALLPMAVNGDKEAIGALVLMFASWMWALVDRWWKDRG